MRYLVVFDDQLGRPSHGVVEDPVGFLAYRVAAGDMTSKQANACSVFEVRGTESALMADLPSRIKRYEFLFLVRHNRPLLSEMLAKGKLTQEQVDEALAELRLLWPLDDRKVDV